MNHIGIRAFTAVCEYFQTFAQNMKVETTSCRHLITGSADPQLNFIFDIHFNDLNTLSADLNTLKAQGFPTLLLCDENESSAFVSFLNEHGYAMIGTAQAKTMSLNASEKRTPNHIAIKEVITPEDMHHWRTIAAQNFAYTLDDDKNLFEHFLKPGPHHEHIKLYLAYLDGRPVGQSMLVMADDFSANMWSSVLPEARRQGVLTAMIHHRNAVAKEHGYHLSVVQCMPMSAPVYDKLGYQNAETLLLCVQS